MLLRDEIAEAINRARYVPGGLPYRTLAESGPSDKDYAYRLADGVLALPALAILLGQVGEETWSKGYEEPWTVSDGGDYGASAKIAQSHESEWTQGICGDAACILRDGLPVEIEKVLEALNARRAAEPSDAVAAVERLPCDVKLPPSTIIRKGCELSVLMTALSRPYRVGLTFPSALEPAQQPAAWNFDMDAAPVGLPLWLAPVEAVDDRSMKGHKGKDGRFWKGDDCIRPRAWRLREPPPAAPPRAANTGSAER